MIRLLAWIAMAGAGALWCVSRPPQKRGGPAWRAHSNAHFIESSAQFDAEDLSNYQASPEQEEEETAVLRLLPMPARRDRPDPVEPDAGQPRLF